MIVNGRKLEPGTRSRNMYRRPNFPFARALVFCILLYPRTAHAYLDPGTGSMILQALAGGVFALAVTFKLWWLKVKELSSRLVWWKAKDSDDAEG